MKALTDADSGTAPLSPDFQPRGFAVVWRTLGLGTAGAVGVFLAGLSRGTAGWNQLPGFLPAAFTLALSGWACERVWHAGVAPFVRGLSEWGTCLTRIPFWFMAGGMGATIGILIAKKYAVLDIQDIPVKPIFAQGAYIYAGLQTGVWLLTGGPGRRKVR